MPYKCVHCSKTYEDGSKEVIEGCSSCKSKFFFYIKPEKLNQIKENQNVEIEFSSEEKVQIEEDVREISGINDPETPVFLDFESISIIKPGKYMIDLAKLFSKQKPLVYKLEDGKYMIDLTGAGLDSKNNLKT